MATQNQPVSSKRRAAGGGSFLTPLTLSSPDFPFLVDVFPADQLRQFAQFRPLAAPSDPKITVFE